MKPLNFLSLFSGFFVILMLSGIVSSLINVGNIPAIPYIGLVALVASLIMAAYTIRIRATDAQNVNKLFKLNFILWFCFLLAQMVLTRLNAESELTFLKVLLLLGICVLGALFYAKIVRMSLQKKRSLV